MGPEVPGTAVSWSPVRHKGRNMFALPRYESWRDQASCKGGPIELFYPEGGTGSPEVKRLCGYCPVRNECFEYSLSLPKHEDRCGIFAGTTAADRRKYRSMRARGQQVTLPPYIEPSLRRRGAKRRPKDYEPTRFRWDAEKGKYVTVKKG
jgi:hypothetical protein